MTTAAEKVRDVARSKIAANGHATEIPTIDEWGNEVWDAGAANALPPGLSVVPGDGDSNAEGTPSTSSRRAMLAVDLAQVDRPPIRSYSTGMADLDRLIGGGLSTRQLTVVLGPPGAGKSAWSVSTTLHLASALPSLYASTELESQELIARQAGHLLDRPWTEIARGQVSRELVVEALRGVRLYVLGSEMLPRDGAAALALIESEATAIAMEHGVPPLVVIDYLQDLARGSEESLRSKVGDLATDCRAMSQRLDCAVIAISSVARSYYGQRRAEEMRAADDASVYLAAAKESGDVDYAAATVLFLDVAEQGGDEASRPARIAVAKARHGRTGFAGGRFYGASGRWESSPASVDLMSSESQGADRGRMLRETDKAAVKHTLASLAKRGREVTKSQLREVVTTKEGFKVPKARASAVITELEVDSEIVLVEVVRNEGGKDRRRAVVRLPEPSVEANSTTESEDRWG